MARPGVYGGLIGLVLATLPARGGEPGRVTDDSAAFFELKVRPTLAGTCLPCHGGKKTGGGLRVDSREALLKGGDLGPAVVPGDPDGSLLVQAVRHTHDEVKMPPPPGRRLPDDVAADLAAWVRSGAAWPEEKPPAKGIAAGTHWAFVPVKPVTPPDAPSGWAAGAI